MKLALYDLSMGFKKHTESQLYDDGKRRRCMTARYFFHFHCFSYIDSCITDDYFSLQIGIECELSAEELAQKIQQTFY